jgi:hypothetical protein
MAVPDQPKQRMIHRGAMWLYVALAVAVGPLAERSLAAAQPIDAYSLESGVHTALVDPQTDWSKRPETGNPLWAVPLSKLSATRDRPIFSPSRRPPPPAVIAAPAPPPPPPPPPPPEPDHPALTLLGTVTGESDGIGIFKDQATSDIVRLKTGEGHDGWRLLSVHERETILERNSRSATLTLPPREGSDAALPDSPVAAQSGTQSIDSGRPMIPAQPASASLPVVPNSSVRGLRIRSGQPE